MRTDFDFAPLYRATVGFDRVFDMLDSMAGQPAHGGYPPYNIEKTADDAWRIVMAVAGFTDAELTSPRRRTNSWSPARATPTATTEPSSSIAASAGATSSAASSWPTTSG